MKITPSQPAVLSACRIIPSCRQVVRSSRLLLFFLLASPTLADLHLHTGTIPISRGKSLDLPQTNPNRPLLWLVAHDENADGNEIRLSLEKNNFSVLGYVPDNGFLLRGKSADLPRIEKMPDIIFVARYEARHKTAPGLREGDEVSVLQVVAGQRLAPRRAKHSRALAESEDVLWLEPAPRFEMLSDIARAQPVMDVDRAWERLGLTGAGETIAIADTGLDTGNTHTLHPAFQGRVEGIAWAASTWADTYYNPHGTKVAGCAVGDGSGSPDNMYAGVAPQANLIMHGITGPNAFLFGDMLDESLLRGARVFSFSYISTNWFGAYEGMCAFFDDYTWRNPDFLFCSGAGNDGLRGAGSVLPPSTAKNVLGVGGSQGRDALLSTLETSQSIWDRSSRGPCLDGRVKPDIVAPGSLVCTTTRVADGSLYTTDSGTSFSTPYVAGCALLVRQWLREQRDVTNPSAALVKAILLNCAQPFVAGETTRPNNTEGWGHVSLFPSLYTLPGMTNRFHDVKTGLLKHQEHVYNVAHQPGVVVHAMLVYSDFHGNPAAAQTAPKLVNDLDLSVIAPDGTVLAVNDRTNNIEQISFMPTQPGTWRVKVRGHRVPFGPQPYALVMRSEPAGPRITSFRVADGKADLEFFSPRGTVLRTTGDLAAPKPWPLEPEAPARLRMDPARNVEIPLAPLEARRFWTAE